MVWIALTLIWWATLLIVWEVDILFFLLMTLEKVVLCVLVGYALLIAFLRPLLPFFLVGFFLMSVYIEYRQ